jgi:O-methyltransferase
MKKTPKPSFALNVSGDLLRKANLLKFIREFIEVSNMPQGYYMEFGILNGEGIVEAYRQLRGVVGHYYGFDSFEGLPELDEQDKKGKEFSPHFTPGNFKSLRREAVYSQLQACTRMTSDELTLVEGYFDKVLPGLDKEKFREKGVPLCVYIDCDLYSSTIQVLDFIDDLVVPGTWILFDDYWHYRGSPQMGEQKAMRDWINKSSRWGLSDYGNYNGFGRAFIVHEK